MQQHISVIPVALAVPDVELVLGCAATEFTALDPDKVTVEERKDAYGASVIAISVNLDESTQSVSGQSPDFSFPSSLSAMTSSGEAAGTSSSVLEADMIDLQRLPAKITQISRDELEVSLQPLTAEDQAEQERERRRELVYDSRDHDSDDDDEEEQILVSMDGNPLTVLQAAATSTSNIPGAISGVITQQIKTLMPGQVISADEIFTLVNNDKQEAADGQASASNASTSSDGTLDVSIDEIASTSGRDSDAPADDSLPSWEAVVGQVLQVVQQLKRVAPNPGDTAEEKQRHMDLMQKLDEASLKYLPVDYPTHYPSSMRLHAPM